MNTVINTVILALKKPRQRSLSKAYELLLKDIFYSKSVNKKDYIFLASAALGARPFANSASSKDLVEKILWRCLGEAQPGIKAKDNWYAKHMRKTNV